ncbi:hypothetical protein EDB81DRAFT_928762 [Dactylonectria macrodidyma]|uniref:Uncharacterized protein n=1 Tax=Dactylonectria macrodidyma TaxID=307937 RepID=A0A9P9JAD8_9HYPO|nr:hypothetical protein EDB81DRAFT_928762 [Dactylonectria macrodidyma]
MSNGTSISGCEIVGEKGEPDFYGLGIRVGIYLQWFSSWMSLLVEPQSAQYVYDTNSIFVFAITMSTILATLSRHPSMKPIHTFIMLQLILGFFVTTLSTVGMRLDFLRTGGAIAVMSRLKKCTSDALKNLFKLKGSSLSRLNQRLLDTWKAVTGRRKKSNGFLRPCLDWMKSLDINWEKVTHVFLIWPLNLILELKPYCLSWSGVLWRTTIAIMVAGFNLWFWWFKFERELRDHEDCQEVDRPFFFPFLNVESTLNFGKIISIVIAALVFLPGLFVLNFTLHLHYIALKVVGKDFLEFIQRKSKTKKAHDVEWRLNNVLRRRKIPLSNMTRQILSKPSPSFRQSGGVLDLIDFFLSFNNQRIHVTDIFKLMVSLENGKLQQEAEDGNTTESQASVFSESQIYQERLLHLLWNICILLSIIWFILSVELTIIKNRIAGVNSINKTDPGQLIPFIIGFVNTLQVFKKVVLVGLTKKYPGWKNVGLVVSESPEGRLEIVRIDR